jgi:hypothetical protein
MIGVLHEPYYASNRGINIFNLCGKKGIAFTHFEIAKVSDLINTN